MAQFLIHVDATAQGIVCQAMHWHTDSDPLNVASYGVRTEKELSVCQTKQKTDECKPTFLDDSKTTDDPKTLSLSAETESGMNASRPSGVRHLPVAAKTTAAMQPSEAEPILSSSSTACSSVSHRLHGSRRLRRLVESAAAKQGEAPYRRSCRAVVPKPSAYSGRVFILGASCGLQSKLHGALAVNE